MQRGDYNLTDYRGMSPRHVALYKKEKRQALNDSDNEEADEENIDDWDGSDEDEQAAESDDHNDSDEAGPSTKVFTNTKRKLKSKQAAGVKLAKMGASKEAAKDMTNPDLVGPSRKKGVRKDQALRSILGGPFVRISRKGKLTHGMSLQGRPKKHFITVLRQVVDYATHVRFVHACFLKFMLTRMFDRAVAFPPCLFHVRFFSSLTQAFLGRRITNQPVIGAFAQTIDDHVTEFKALFPSLRITLLADPHHQKMYGRPLDYVARQQCKDFSNHVTENLVDRIWCMVQKRLAQEIKGLKTGHLLSIAKHIANGVLKMEEQDPLPTIDYSIQGDLPAAIGQLTQDLCWDMKSAEAFIAITIKRADVADERVNLRIETAKMVWACHDQLGCRTTMETLVDIARAHGFTKHRHVYLHYLMVIDKFAELSNSETYAQVKRPQEQATNAWAYHELSTKLKQWKNLGRRQHSRLVRAVVQTVNSSALFDGTKWPSLTQKSIETIKRTVATAIKQISWSRKCLQRCSNDPQFLARCFFPFEHVKPATMRLIGPSPTPSFQRLHLTLDNPALYDIVITAGLQAFLPKGSCVSDLVKQGYFVNEGSLVSEEHPNGKYVFTDIITTNGHVMTTVYAKRKISRPLPQLSLQDFEPWELPFLSPWAVDPGDRDLITAVNDCDPHMYESPAFVPSEADLNLPRLPHQVRSFSSVEYRKHILKTQKQMQRWKRKAGIDKVESAIPTYRTVCPATMDTYLEYLNENWMKLLRFYASIRFAKAKFNIWRQCQIQNDEVVNILINGGRKYQQDPPGKITSRDPIAVGQKWRPAPVANDTRKLPVIFYGAAIIGASVFKGRKTQAGLSKKVKAAFKRADAQLRLLLVEVDEYLTSQVCSRCATRSLNHVNVNPDALHLPRVSTTTFTSPPCPSDPSTVSKTTSTDTFFTNEETITITTTKHTKETREELDEEQPGRVLGTTVSSSSTHDDDGSSYLHVLTTTVTSNQPTFTSTLVTTNTVTTATSPRSTADDLMLYSVLKCENCRTLWHRDRNAARNILSIATHVIQYGHRPSILNRPITDPQETTLHGQTETAPAN
ncbi:hypothetical protein DM01DRAFT_1369914 [Hesseltinella vesiculosa]|uniref:Uncharacterized protein n=1 Tax=Hesseltinella vesiculosa TaxID=101127 RepID=A0A1X2GVE2_9FUNG|nr:hypothetical protein DM01DRAFT_1369914 [Hesseltinella vesiculosa]